MEITTTLEDRTHQRRPAYKKPILFIEVQLNDNASNNPLIRTDCIRREVYSWLDANFREVQVAQRLDTRSLTYGEYVRSLEIADHSETTVYPDKTFHTISEQDLEIAVYSLFDVEDEGVCATPPMDEKDQSPIQFKTTQLPHRTLDGLWEALVFAEPIAESLLRVITEMMEISNEPLLNPALVCWHNLALLYGPPGSGKTTLAQALAQKLSIRTSQIYSATKVLQINSSTLHSKWFGESSKLVGKLFETILTMSADETLLTVVVIDEVETLAGSREKASRGNECGDAIRVSCPANIVLNAGLLERICCSPLSKLEQSTNELLQGLDRLRRRSNVVLICTSNLVDDIDSAFVDRCGIQQFVGTPSVDCAYEIFRSVINELIKVGLVFFDAPEFQKHLAMSNSDGDGHVGQSSPLPQIDTDAHTDMQDTERDDDGSGNRTYIPDFQWVDRYLSQQNVAEPVELGRIAEMAIAEGVSGRMLRRLPLLAMTKYTVRKPRDLRDVLIALERIVTEQNKDKKVDVTRSKQKDTLKEDDVSAMDLLSDTSIDNLLLSCEAGL